MDKEQIKHRVFRVITENLDVSEDEIKEDSHIQNDLGADSLDLVELVMALEEEFETEIDDGEAEKLVSVDKIIDFVANHS